MNLIVLCVFATSLVASALAWEDMCPAKCVGASDRSECDCCPEPCCCRCTKGNDGPVIIPMCSSKLDVIMIIDSSSSIKDSGWEFVRAFLQDVVRKLDNIGTDIKVSVIRYSVGAQVDWNLNGMETIDQDALQAAFQQLELLGGITNTVAGLEAALTQVLGSSADDPDKNNVVFFMSDGRTSFDADKVPALAQQIQQQARVVSLGVTNMINATELNIIATGDDGSNFFQVDSFTELPMVLDEVATKVCTSAPPPTGKECFCCCPPPWELRPKSWYYGY